MRLFHPKLLLLTFLFPLLLNTSCKKEEDANPDELKTTSITIQNQFHRDPKLMVNLHDGLVYNRTEATNNQGKVDFIFWNYDGEVNVRNCYLMSVSVAYNQYYGDEKSVAEVCGLGSWTELTAGTLTETTISVAEFDGIRSKADLSSLLNKVNTEYSGFETITNSNGELLANIYAFSDDKGRKGLFRVANVKPGPDGYITIVVKMEK